MIVTKYSEMKENLVFCFISRWVKFRHAKLTAGGEGRVRMLAIECASFFLFFPLLTVLVFFHDQTRALTRTRKVRRHAERPKETESSSLHSISGLQINV